MYNAETISVLQVGALPIGYTMAQGYVDSRLDATSDEWAVIYRVLKDMTIDNVILNVFALTGTPTYQVSIQGVSTTGDPDGAILGGGSPASDQWAPAGTGLNVVTLDNSITVSLGDMIAIVVEDGTSGTNPSGSHFIDLRSRLSQIGSSGPPMLSLSTDTGSTWTKQASVMPLFGLRNSGVTTDVMGCPILIATQGTVQTASIDDIAGQGFMLPTSLGSRVQVGGVAVFGVATTEFEVGIWDEDSTEMGAQAIDDDHQIVAATRIVGYWSPIWLKTGVKYYAGVRHTETGGLVLIYGLDVVTDDNLSAFSGYPNNSMALHNGTSWSDEAGFIADAVHLLVTDWDKHGVEMDHLQVGMSR